VVGIQLPLQRQRPLAAGPAALQPLAQADAAAAGDLAIAEAQGPVAAGPHPQLAGAMADAELEAGVPQMVQQFSLDLGHQVAGGFPAAGGVVAEGALAQALVGGAEHLVVGETVPQREASGLLAGEVEVGDGELTLGLAHAGRRSRHRLGSDRGG
jgi:hypothetical protein